MLALSCRCYKRNVHVHHGHAFRAAIGSHYPYGARMRWTFLNGHDPYRCLKDVLDQWPTQPASRIGELLPHSWTLATTPSS